MILLAPVVHITQRSARWGWVLSCLLQGRISSTLLPILCRQDRDRFASNLSRIRCFCLNFPVFRPSLLLNDSCIVCVNLNTRGTCYSRTDHESNYILRRINQSNNDRLTKPHVWNNSSFLWQMKVDRTGKVTINSRWCRCEKMEHWGGIRFTDGC